MNPIKTFLQWIFLAITLAGLFLVFSVVAFFDWLFPEDKGDYYEN
jgi:hypothetical protein